MHNYNILSFCLVITVLVLGLFSYLPLAYGVAIFACWLARCMAPDRLMAILAILVVVMLPVYSFGNMDWIAAGLESLYIIVIISASMNVIPLIRFLVQNEKAALYAEPRLAKLIN